MRIAQIAPLFERVPPKFYGGTERVVYALTEELVCRGHDVTLFATRDSITSARLVPMAETGARLGGASDPIALHVAMLDEVFAQVDDFDVVHSHVDALAFPFARTALAPTIHTMHGRLDLPERRRALLRFPDQRLISISHSQRLPVRQLPLRWVGTVHNGIRIEHFPYRAEPDDPPYLLFLGRISPEKGPVEAIQVARRAGIPLKIAAKIDPAERDWAERTFLPHLEGPGVEYLGEVDERTKAELLGGALALLFPIQWPEPFGIVLAEALACGTPVLALRRGAVEEVMVHRETGYVCDDLDGLAAAVSLVERVDRRACRCRVEALFSAAAMADKHEEIYQRVAEERDLARVHPVSLPDRFVGPERQVLADPALPPRRVAGEFGPGEGDLSSR